MVEEPLVEQIQHILDVNPEIMLAYLFGSRVSGIIGPMSDIDLALLVAPGEAEAALIARIGHELRKIYVTEPVDIISLNRAPIELAYAIIAQGSCIHKRDEETRVEYEANVMSLYGDYLPVLRAHQEEILQGDADAQRVKRYREALRRTERTLSEIKASKDATQA